MIVRLMPEQIAEHWDAIKHAACQSNAISHTIEEQYCNKLFEMLLLEKYHAWVGYQVVDGQREYMGILITGFIRDDLTGQLNLLVYGLYAFRVLDDDLIIEGLQTLKMFARAQNCTKIFGYTSNPRLIKFLKDKDYLTDTICFTSEV